MQAESCIYAHIDLISTVMRPIFNFVVCIALTFILVSFCLFILIMKFFSKPFFPPHQQAQKQVFFFGSFIIKLSITGAGFFWGSIDIEDNSEACLERKLELSFHIYDSKDAQKASATDLYIQCLTYIALVCPNIGSGCHHRRA